MAKRLSSLVTSSDLTAGSQCSRLRSFPSSKDGLSSVKLALPILRLEAWKAVLTLLFWTHHSVTGSSSACSVRAHGISRQNIPRLDWGNGVCGQSCSCVLSQSPGCLVFTAGLHGVLIFLYDAIELIVGNVAGCIYSSQPLLSAT